MVASRSRAKKSNRGGGGLIGKGILLIIALGVLAAFYQIPADPTAHGFVASLVSRSQTVGTWVKDLAHGLNDGKINIPAGGKTGAATPAPSTSAHAIGASTTWQVARTNLGTTNIA